MPLPLCSSTGGRTSRTFRPQCVAKPASSACAASAPTASSAAASAGAPPPRKPQAPPPVEAEDHVLVLAAHSQAVEVLLGHRLLGEPADAAPPGGDLGVDLGR